MIRFWDRFWFDFRISDLHLAIVRVVFFSIFALDAWLQISHAPRYSAGDFNVAQLPGVESLFPAPSRALMLALFVGQAYLAAVIALARPSRIWVGVLTVLFGYGYFVSQLNSYQHHFMMFLVIAALSFVRWQRGERQQRALGDWPLRLVLVITSAVYFWAIVTKWEPMWLEGRTLATQVTDGWARDLLERFLQIRSDDPQASWARAAKLVMVVEAALAVAIHIRILRLPAALLGISFHLGIEFSGFQIGMFSYFMVALYLLVLPVDDIRRWLSRWIPRLAVPEQGKPPKAPSDGAPSRDAMLLGIVTLAIAGAFFALSFVAIGGLFQPIFIAVVGAVILLRAARRAKTEAAEASTAGPAWHLAAAGFAVLLGSALILTMPFDETVLLAATVAILGCGLVATARVRGRGLLRTSIVHVAVCAALLILPHVTDTARDYYRFWGGSARRLKQPEVSKRAYARLMEVAPDYGPGYASYAGLIADEDPERAIELCRRAQKLAPNDHRGYLGEAMIHHKAGRGEEALRAARMAEAMSPGHKRATAIMDHWRRRRKR